MNIEISSESPECMPSGAKIDEPTTLGGSIETLVFKALAKGAVIDRMAEDRITMRIHLIGGWSRLVTFTGSPDELGALRSILTSHAAFKGSPVPLRAQMLARTYPGVSSARLAIVSGLGVSAVESILSANYDEASFVKACLKDLSDKENPAIAC